jgi:carboxypeptidase T
MEADKAMLDVLIVAKSLEHLKALDDLCLDIKYRAARQESSNRFVVPGVLTLGQVQKAKDAGYDVMVVSDLSEVVQARQAEVSKINRFIRGLSVQEMAAATTQGYMNADEVEDCLKKLSELHPELISLIPLQKPSWEGFKSHAVCLSAGDRADRVGVFFTGSVHAREWGGSEICVSFVNSLLSAYLNKGPLQFGGKVFTPLQVKTIMERLNIYVFPDVNPDGKSYSQRVDDPGGEDQNFWWRKNRNPNTDVDPNFPGVDLNRNFDFLWSSGIGTSANPQSIFYKGAAPFSEPETQNVLSILEAHDDISYYVDIHSYGELIVYNWGDDDNQGTDPGQNFRNPAFNGKRGNLGDDVYREFISPLDEIEAIGIAMRMNDALAAVSGRRYQVKQSVGIYATSGASDDYAFSRHQTDGSKSKIRAFTIEFGEQFVPCFAAMTKIIQEVDSSMTELCWIAASEMD